MKIYYLPALLFCLLTTAGFSKNLFPASANNSSNTTTDSLKNNNEPVPFSPGTHHDGDTILNASPAFSPDGRSVYFTRTDKRLQTLVVSFKTGETWSEPKPASFSGKYRDLEATMAPDGKYLIFASSRPIGPAPENITGFWGGKQYPAKGGNLWKVSRKGKDWSKPELLPAQINANTTVFSPAVAANGNLYFMRADSGKKFHIYFSEFKGGQYGAALLAGFSQTAYADFDPAVAPDESFIIFSSPRPPAPANHSDLFIVFKTAGGWSEATDLRKYLGDDVWGVEARLSPDLQTLYFSNPRNGQGAISNNEQFIWSVNITGMLKSAKPQ